MEVLEEQLQIVAGLWADGPFSFEGRHYAIGGIDARPKPVQRPRPPLIMGGGGGPRSLRLGARYADEYNTVYKTTAECAEMRRNLDEACRREGRDPIPLSLMTGWLAGEDRAELLDRAGRLAEWRGHGGGAEELLRELPDAWLAGTLDELTPRLDELAGAGVERVMLQHLLHRDLDVVEQIGRRVAPTVRDAAGA
jgi:alkanesulfonate monooxygenase SsuD/methylene tetrahydromethanopterin reductase-like flavin-dependent oxidoreductase (luciferase family)